MPVAEAPRRLLRFDPFELDTRAGELRKRGLKVRLQEKPLRLLEVLGSNATGQFNIRLTFTFKER